MMKPEWQEQRDLMLQKQEQKAEEKLQELLLKERRSQRRKQQETSRSFNNASKTSQAKTPTEI